jgi:hypothetical protein
MTLAINLPEPIVFEDMFGYKTWDEVPEDRNYDNDYEAYRDTVTTRFNEAMTAIDDAGYTVEEDDSAASEYLLLYYLFDASGVPVATLRITTDDGRYVGNFGRDRTMFSLERMASTICGQIVRDEDKTAVLVALHGGDVDSGDWSFTLPAGSYLVIYETNCVKFDFGLEA